MKLYFIILISFFPNLAVSQSQTESGLKVDGSEFFVKNEETSEKIIPCHSNGRTITLTIPHKPRAVIAEMTPTDNKLYIQTPAEGSTVKLNREDTEQYSSLPLIFNPICKQITYKNTRTGQNENYYTVVYSQFEDTSLGNSASNPIYYLVLEILKLDAKPIDSNKMIYPLNSLWSESTSYDTSGDIVHYKRKSDSKTNRYPLGYKLTWGTSSLDNSLRINLFKYSLKSDEYSEIVIKMNRGQDHFVRDFTPRADSKK